MKLEQLTTPLIPRSTMNCLDLGILFYGQNIASILKLWAWFAVPLGACVYLFSAYWEWDLRYVAVMLHFVSAPFGVMLAERTIQSVLGGSFDAPSESPERSSRIVTLCLKTLGVRVLTLIGLIALILPGWWTGVRYSFLVETACLSDLQGRTHDRRWKELVKQELGSLLQRSLVICFFLLGMFVSLFFCLDFLSSQLFDFPLLQGRIADQLSLWLRPGDTLQIMFSYFYSDPLVLTVSSLVLLLIYPVARFAWFFCYIDLRVRGDFWDLELRFQKEAERLGEAAT